jgi:hypothetical protein
MKHSTLLLVLLTSDAALFAAGLVIVATAEKRWERHVGNGLLIVTGSAGGYLLSLVFL